ncbi:alcohol acetyltransferase [Dipodascopsis uninucleata]
MERNLGVFENYFAVRASLDFYGVVVMWIEYDIPIRDQELISKAVHCMVRDHAPLRATINLHPPDNVKPTVRILDPQEFDVNDYIKYEMKDKLDMVSILNEMHSSKLDPSGILWRIVVVNEKLIAIMFDHTFMDGDSGAMALQYIDKYINNPTEPPLSVDMTMKPLEDLIRINGPLMYNIKEIWNDWMSSGRKSMFEDYAVTSNDEQRWYILHIDKERVVELLQKCRSNGATLTTLFHTILVNALSITYNLDSKYLIECAIPVNLRRKMSSEYSQVMGSFISAYTAHTPATTKFDWKMCKDLKHKLTDATGKDSIAYKVGLLYFMSNKLEKWMSDKIGKRRSTDTEITNVGAKKFQTDGTYTVIDSGFSQGRGVLNPGMALSCIGVAGGSVNITFCYTSSIVKGDEMAEKFLSKFQQILNEI